MELKKELLDVDFIVDSRPLTKKEKLEISEFIKADKAKRSLKEKRATKSTETLKEKETV